MTIMILALVLVGALSIAAGSYLIWGAGVALLVGGALSIAAAVVAARGAALNG